MIKTYQLTEKEKKAIRHLVNVIECNYDCAKCPFKTQYEDYECMVDQLDEIAERG